MNLGTAESANNRLNDIPVQNRFVTLESLQSQINAISKKLRGSNQILYSNGVPASNPTCCLILAIDYTSGALYYKDSTGVWQPVPNGGGGGGSGTVNAGLANRLAYYPANGTTVDDLAAITPNRALISDANGLPIASVTTNTELSYVNNVTSNIQTQLNGKEPTITAGTTSQYWRGDKTFQPFPTYNYWDLNGSSISSSNFLGTTNAQPLKFKVNNNYWGFFDSNTAYDNIAIGRNALPLTQVPGTFGVTGGNTAFGLNTLANNTGGWWNTAIQNNALFNNTTGFDNIAIGNQALYNNTSGIRNLALGNVALSSNTTGQSNTAIASHALQNTTSDNNTAVGAYANLSGGESLGNNTCIGFSAGYWGGSYNSIVGAEALHDNANPVPSFTQAIRASVIGYKAFKETKGSIDLSGIGANILGANNISNATAIGANAYVGASNSLVLGSINGTNGAAASTKVGIGISIPLFTLDLLANVAATLVTNIYNSNATGKGLAVSVNNVVTDGTVLQALSGLGGTTSLFEVTADGKTKIPSLTNLTTQNRIVGQLNTNGQLGYITLGSGLTLASGVLTLTGTAINFADEESPTGTKNSSNVTFTLAHTPIAGSLKLYFRGLRLKLTDDYTLSTATITMVTAPDSGDALIADYRY